MQLHLPSSSLFSLLCWLRDLHLKANKENVRLTNVSKFAGETEGNVEEIVGGEAEAARGEANVEREGQVLLCG
jgi:hypothetical protein